MRQIDSPKDTDQGIQESPIYALEVGSWTKTLYQFFTIAGNPSFSDSWSGKVVYQPLMQTTMYHFFQR